MKGFLKKMKERKDDKKSKKNVLFDVQSNFAQKYEVKEVLGKCVAVPFHVASGTARHGDHQ